MEHLIAPFSLFIIAAVCACLLAVAVPFALWYYLRAREIAPLLTKKAALETIIENLTKDIHEAREQLDKLTEDVARAKETIAQGDQAKQWLVENKKTIDDLEVQVAKVKAEYEGALQQLQDVQKRVSDKQLELAELNKKLGDVGAKIDEAQKKIEQLPEEYRKVREQLETEVNNLRTEKGKIEAEIAALKAEKESLPKEVETLRSRLNELQKQEGQLRHVLNDLNKEVAVAKGEIDRLKGERDALKDQIRRGREEAKKISDETQLLLGQAAAAKQWIAQQQAIKADSDEKWKNLNLAVFDDKTESAKRNFSKIDEKIWLDEFQDRLDRCGFVFNPRAIKAFHTGLKCAQSTPLVVLAGISGTGKSLLPELYSAALGMNFLPVPVQPRWDSPQDLFGFYNYMEGRYKATELSRLLWQYDIYNNPGMKGITTDHLPMNLVLLDEMNLARVEYYFSDLLSKLEMRNGLDESNAEDRKKAQIELECNAADKAESTRHLFVSPRTLFVGTMNEDESTQTLSDKVIDRSNVLRFGRPANLDAKPEKGRFLSECRDATRISARQWDSWCVKLTEEDETADLKFLRETLTPVVEALDSVNRPYGFRVDNAMKTYVLNYPGNVKEAVADQIEMKVLPKLNGVELDSDGFQQHVKGALREAIARTDDAGLLDSFEKSCPDGATFFKWRGVMR